MWVRGAPSFEANTEQEVQQFIDRYVTCQLPKEDANLCSLLSMVQKHTHSVACKKHGQTCRFLFPRPPVPYTLALKPPDKQPSSALQDHYSKTLLAVYDQLDNLEPHQELSFDQLLQRALVTEHSYIEAIKWIKTKNGRPSILLKRSPNEININSYNTLLMKAWEANLDIQYVTDTYACVMYVASYVSKPEKTLGNVLNAVSSSAQHLGPKSRMKTVARKFLTHREVSAQEAIYRILSLPLIQGSRQIVFIPTDLPENRTRLMKPLRVIETLEDDDPDVFMAGLLDRYAARPSSLDTMTLAEFASKYRVAAGPTKSDMRQDDTDDNEDSSTQLPSTISLRSGLSSMSLRQTPAIIRYHQWSKKKQIELYYHSQLLLYLTWRNEKDDIMADNYQDMYMKNIDIIQQNRSHFEHHADDVASAVESLEELGPPEESWHTLAPQTEQMQADDKTEGQEILPNTIPVDPDLDKSVNRDIGLVPFEIEFRNEKLTKHEWYSLVMSFNALQTDVHNFIVHWCTQMLHSFKTGKPDPVHLFLTGGAGVGKSHLVRTIVQTVTFLFSRDSQVDEMHVLVCAPTGAAAYNICGYTLHSAFLLPLLCRKTDDYIPLSGEKLTSLKQTIGNIKLLIIDEISMVGADMLLTVHRRLCDIMGNEEPFGGVSVLAVGDLLKLPPVAQEPVFAPPSYEMAAIYGSLWQNHFQIVELTEIQRQKDDIQFAKLLNRIRDGSHTHQDLDIVRSRQILPDSHEYPTLATHIFAYNKDVSDHNVKQLNSLITQQYIFKAEDTTKDDQTGTVNATSFKDMAGGLASTLILAEGARVMLTKNIDVQDGLVNSASGVVTGFQPPYEECKDPASFKPKYILVKFDDSRVGQRKRKVSRGLLSDNASTPIPTVESQIQFGMVKCQAGESSFLYALHGQLKFIKNKVKQNKHLWSPQQEIFMLDSSTQLSAELKIHLDYTYLVTLQLTKLKSIQKLCKKLTE